MDRQVTVTHLLGALRAGDRAAFGHLFPIVYEELRALAQRQRRGWRGDETLNTTGLVHEAYLKLVAHERADWRSRGHFGAVAAKAMRHILIDHARGRQAAKRGGDLVFVSLDVERDDERVEDAWTADNADELLALDEALERLGQASQRQARIVEMKFFAGLSNEEIADVLGVSLATVKRGWALAQAWLYREIAGSR